MELDDRRTRATGPNPGATTLSALVALAGGAVLPAVSFGEELSAPPTGTGPVTDCASHAAAAGVLTFGASIPLLVSATTIANLRRKYWSIHPDRSERTRAFLLTTLVIVVTPGTGSLFTIAAGLSRGWRASIVAAAGCTLGIVPHMVAAITGLAALLNASAVAFQSVKYAGSAYLLYLAWRTFRDRTPLKGNEDALPQAWWRVIWTAVLINVLNPKLTIFFFAFLPQFVRPTERDSIWHLIGLSGVFMATTLVVFVLYGLFAAGMRRQVLNRPRVVQWMRRTFAATYVLVARRLALETR